jgi:hypothetical protein
VAARLHRIGSINAYHSDSQKRDRQLADAAAKELRETASIPGVLARNS